MKVDRHLEGASAKQGRSSAGKLRAKVLSVLGLVATALALCCSSGCEKVLAPSESELKEQILKMYNEKFEKENVGIKASRVTNLTIVSESFSKYIGKADVEFQAGNDSSNTAVIQIEFKLTGNKFTDSMLEVSPVDKAEAGLKFLGLGLKSSLGL